MPKININGLVREMTAEEVKQMEALAAQIPQPVKSELEERLEKLEKLLARLGVNVD